MTTSRRDFIKRFVTSTGALAAPMFVPATAFGANSSVGLGFIGVGARGLRDIVEFLRDPAEARPQVIGRPVYTSPVGIRMICDVDQYQLDRIFKHKEKIGADPEELLFARELEKADPAKSLGRLTSDNITDKYMTVLNHRDVDAVVIATPDHWHALMCIQACRAGKHVYCEPPLTFNITEGQRIVTESKKSARILLVGSQLRAARQCRLACELVKSKKIGDLKRILIGIPEPEFHVRRGTSDDPTDDPTKAKTKYTSENEQLKLLFNLQDWCGPAPFLSSAKEITINDRVKTSPKKRFEPLSIRGYQYNENHIHHNFRYFWNYGGGPLASWGAHYLDLAHWAMDDGNNIVGPTRVTGRVLEVDDKQYEVPKRCAVKYVYNNGVEISVTQGRNFASGTTAAEESNPLGITFIGTTGAIFVRMQPNQENGSPRLFPDPKHYNKSTLDAEHTAAAFFAKARTFITSVPVEIVEVRLRMELLDPDKLSSKYTLLPDVGNYKRHFIECITHSSVRPIADVTAGHRAATACHLGNMALLTKSEVTWDPQTESLTGVAAGLQNADTYAGHKYRRVNRRPYDVN